MDLVGLVSFQRLLFIATESHDEWLPKKLQRRVLEPPIFEVIPLAAEKLGYSWPSFAFVGTSY